MTRQAEFPMRNVSRSFEARPPHPEVRPRIKSGGASKDGGRAPQDEGVVCCSKENPHPEEQTEGLRREGWAEGRAIARDEIIRAARDWINTPYVHQASAKGAGADCLGLVRGVWRELYGGEPEIPPPYTPDWNERRGDEPLLGAAQRNMAERLHADAKPGDVLIFRVAADGPAKHCGIMSAPDRFIHAYAGRHVCESWLYRWWLSRLAGVFIFPGADEWPN